MNRRGLRILAAIVARIDGDQRDAELMRDLAIHNDQPEQYSYWNGRAASLAALRRVIASTLRYEQNRGEL